MAQPYTEGDLLNGETIVRRLHGLKGFEAWSECVAQAIAAERERCAKIVEGELYETRYRKWPQISTDGNLSEDNETTKHCAALALVLRHQG